MNNQTDPQIMISQAQALLTDIKKTHDDFVIKTSAKMDDINSNLKQMAKFDQELQKMENKLVDQADAVILKSLVDK